MAENLLKVEGQWKLSKYGRFLQVTNSDEGSGSGGSGDGKKDGDWKVIDGNLVKPLSISLLKNGSLLVHHGREILENHSLINCTDNWRVVCKGDSMLFVYKIQDVTRKFRIMLSANDVQNGSEYCRNLCRHLSGYLIIKDLSPTKQEEAEGGEGGRGDAPLKESGRMFHDGVATMRDLVQQMTSSTRSLPLAYSQCTVSDSELINSCIRLCLSDSSFPSFVGQVEKQLLKIIGDKPPK